MKILAYTDTGKPVGDPDHLKLFYDQDAADAWFREHDPEGVAFVYDLIGQPKPVPIGSRSNPRLRRRG